MPDGDFDAQYAEVADEPRTSYTPFESLETGGTFDEKLADLCQDIVEEYEKSRATLTNPAGSEDSDGDGYIDGNDLMKLPSYEKDIRQLALEEFPIFFDAANIDRFSKVSETLNSIATSLVAANDDSSFEQLQVLIGKWDGTAADSFEIYLGNLGTTMAFQRAFVGDVGAAAAHFEELMKRMRVDAYGLAKNLMLKVDPTSPNDGMAVLSTILVVGGLIAAGVLTFGSGPLIGAVGAATFGEFAIAGIDGVTQIQDNLKGDDGGERDREIHGEEPPDYIQSCRERIEEILTTGQGKADLVMDTLYADMTNEQSPQLFLSRPEIADATRYNESKMTLKGGFEVSSVAELRRAGDVIMPIMAKYFENARASASQLTGLFTDGVGQSVVASAKASIFAKAANLLERSFTHLRDNLYESGQALIAIADDYARLEEQHEEMMNYVKELSKAPGTEYEDERKYKPQGEPQAPSPAPSKPRAPVPGE